MLKKIFGAPLTQILLLTALVIFGMLWPVPLLEHFENKSFDFWSARFRHPQIQSIAIVAIDTESIRRLGDLSRSRSRIADIIALLSSSNARAQGLCLLLDRPDDNPGLAEIDDIRTRITDSHWKGQKKTSLKIKGMLDQAHRRLDHDRRLIAAVRRARNVVLPIRFVPDAPPDDEAKSPLGLLIINSLKAPAPAPHASGSALSGVHWIGNADNHPPVAAGGLRQTFDDLAGKAGALAHINPKMDADGVVRRVPLLVEFKGRLFPSMALQLSLEKIDAKLRNLEIEQNLFGHRRLRVQHLELLTDSAYHMLVSYDPQWTRKRTFAMADLLDGTMAPDLFRDKVVLIGVTDPGEAPAYRVGGHSGVTMVELAANMLARILSKTQLSRPGWAIVLELVAALYFAFFLAIFIPRVNLQLGASLLLIFLLTWYAVGAGLLLGYGYWIKPFGPILLACFGFAMVQLTIYSRVRRQEKLESNKTLGLSYQEQGRLDMAYEKYMQCPAEDDSVKHLLYSLGLDFERKRMFNKAAAIYQHISARVRFKDTKERIARIKLMEDPMAMTTGSSVGEATIKVDDTDTKPTFGRYEILKELGHGAMGTVYLGKDPKINREVAIKTLEYAEVEHGDLEEVKGRFFREAEAAGKLSHPSIVSIFDVGEEHDMAYIAMERLDGDDLTRFCQADNLLPMPRVLWIIDEVAEALAYAHKEGVVHRDIKPGNIMLLDDGRVKVTDFGIARVVDDTQTRSGVVLGTPSYMSPEQVAGKYVDGRSDLFTLGIVLYQLLTGEKPFKGDNITTIMYAITHNAHAPLSDILPDIPSCVEQIVDKLLAKGVSKRFKSADQLAKALKNCKKEVYSGR